MAEKIVYFGNHIEMHRIVTFLYRFSPTLKWLADMARHRYLPKVPCRLLIMGSLHYLKCPEWYGVRGWTLNILKNVLLLCRTYVNICSPTLSSVLVHQQHYIVNAAASWIFPRIAGVSLCQNTFLRQMVKKNRKWNQKKVNPRHNSSLRHQKASKNVTKMSIKKKVIWGHTWQHNRKRGS